ncbi:Hypothetical Protein SLY_0338 [Strawberry lethal yellows phytoplasma (CPA) str. NZSb11]|uniref:Uncharacterized protein n=1 Tax=Strawberry lethal yellows phytoplasma (CPA) str. NZSb11 TaxID=980422 RepID=R4S0G9_PHYAS|nr:Hypothetical Protein SLY_0338 [Strawberry lethal yellows phytoplasma (CPA) str. NZSb11]
MMKCLHLFEDQHYLYLYFPWGNIFLDIFVLKKYSLKLKKIIDNFIFFKSNKTN